MGGAYASSVGSLAGQPRAAARGKCRVDSSGVLPVVREVRVLSAVLFLGSFSFSLEIVTDVEVKV